MPMNEAPGTQKKIEADFATRLDIRWVIVCLLVFTLLTSRSGIASDDSRTEKWYVSFEVAQKRAKSQNVPMVLHFYAHWCGPCRVMESEVLNSSDVQSALGAGIIGVKIDSDARRDLVSRFGVSSLPTDVIVTSDGKILSKDIGSPGRMAYVARLSRFRAPSSAPVQAPKETHLARVPRVSENPVRSGNSVDPGNSGSPAVSGAQTGVPVAAPGSNAVSGSSVSPVKIHVVTTQTLQQESEKQIGLRGFSPVSLTESEEWKTGDTQFQYEFEGVCYLLASSEELERFKASPERFVPALNGCDPVSLVNEQTAHVGNLELGVTYRSKVYFFSTKRTRDEFLKNPEKFSGAVNISVAQSETAG